MKEGIIFYHAPIDLIVRPAPSVYRIRYKDEPRIGSPFQAERLDDLDGDWRWIVIDGIHHLKDLNNTIYIKTPYNLYSILRLYR